MGFLTQLRTRLGRPSRFRRRDFERRERFRGDYRALAGALERTIRFDSVLDVGCANGFLIEALQETGKTVGGIEASPAVEDVLPESLRELVRVGDFTLAEQDGRRWDLVACIEVAEHVPPARTDELVRSLAAAARSWIFFTAAPPGQGGHGHINCRPRQDWLDRFAARGWREDPERSPELRERLAGLESVPWIGANGVLLTSAAAGESAAGLQSRGESVE